MTYREKRNIKGCEILAPAGTKEAFIAAVEAGADAVYVGGTLFNARMNASNFNMEEMKQAADFAHKRGVALYVTVNTLIQQQELADALDYCGKLYEIGVDALIVQDTGLALLLKESYPDFPLHLSTQGTVYNAEGVRFAEKQGFERVVLARELTIDEIREITQETKTEIEVFVHGALCMCYSGQCQMSRFIGGRSGNRGECAQPCRLPYRAFDEKGRLIEDMKYPLSPADLCLVERIGDLVEAGVTSLKIEGRMKSPEYVAQVVSIYRKYLDLFFEKGVCSVDEQDMERLKQIFNRGGFTEGFFGNRRGRKYLSGNIPKHRGLLIGKVVNPQAGRDLVDVQIDSAFKEQFIIGDGVEIQGRNGRAGNLVTYFKPINKNLVRIGDIKGAKKVISKGDPLYRITSTKQMKDLKKYYADRGFQKGRFLRKQKIAAKVAITEEGRIRASLKIIPETTAEDRTHSRLMNILDVQVSAESEKRFEIAEDIRNLSTRFCDSFGKTGNTAFDMVDVEIHSSISQCHYSISMSDINRIRRQLFALLEKAVEDRARRPQRPAVEVKKSPINKERKVSVLELFFFSLKDLSAYVLDRDIAELQDKGLIQVRYLVPAYELIESREWLQQPEYQDFIGHIVPFVGNVIQGRAAKALMESVSLLKQVADMYGDGTVYAGNIGFMQPLLDANIGVRGDFGLNVYNQVAEDFFLQQGLVDTAWSLETMDRDKSIFPLMISRHDFAAQGLSGRGKNFRIKELKGTEQQIIIPQDRGGKKNNALLNDLKKKIWQGEKTCLRLYID